MKKPTREELKDFAGFCRNATNQQVVNIYWKEKDAGRSEYARVAREEAIKRRLF